MRANNKQEKYHKIMDKKMSLTAQELCRGLPAEFSLYMEYIRSLRFYDVPDYGHTKKLFRELFLKENYELDFMYDWTINDNVTNDYPAPKERLQVVINHENNKSLNENGMTQEKIDFTNSLFKNIKVSNSNAESMNNSERLV